MPDVKPRDPAFREGVIFRDVTRLRIGDEIGAEAEAVRQLVHGEAIAERLQAFRRRGDQAIAQG